MQALLDSIPIAIGIALWEAGKFVLRWVSKLQRRFEIRRRSLGVM